jgi:hypothetical protein
MNKEFDAVRSGMFGALVLSEKTHLSGVLERGMNL